MVEIKRKKKNKEVEKSDIKQLDHNLNAVPQHHISWVLILYSRFRSQTTFQMI